MSTCTIGLDNEGRANKADATSAKMQIEANHGKGAKSLPEGPSTLTVTNVWESLALKVEKTRPREMGEEERDVASWGGGRDGGKEGRQKEGRDEVQGKGGRERRGVREGRSEGVGKEEKEAKGWHNMAKACEI